MAAPLVFITGASSGIGLALARACPWPDARIIGVSRRAAPGCVHVEADLADPGCWPEVAGAIAREVSACGGERIVFFHSAGTLTPIGFAGEQDAREYTRNVLLNSAAPQVLGDAFLRAVAGSEARCHFVNISSGAARKAYRGWSGYCAGKAAAEHWVRAAALEQEERGGRVRLLSVAPGVVATAMQAEIRETPARDFPEVDRFVAMHREGTLRDPDAVARELWALVDTKLRNGAVLDLRD